MIEFEDQYLAVLQNIEAALASLIRNEPKVTDYDVRAAVGEVCVRPILRP